MAFYTSSMQDSSDIRFETADRSDPIVRDLYADFIREVDGLIDIAAENAAGPPPNLDPPAGVMLLARVDGDPAAIGGVRHLDSPIAEVKSMYVAPAYRGAGLAGLLLEELHAIAAERGARATRLDTSAYLTAAVALYRSAGYTEVADYNGNVKADLWFERRLDEPVVVAPYDPGWPGSFERERAALEEAIGPWAVGGIHHVGSTAVPGLDAKPIVDILVGVEDLESSRACFEPLAALDYLHSPYLSETMHWFCKPHPSHRTHHLHLIPTSTRRYADELAFRDLLRTDPGTAGEYAALKHELAARFGSDRDGYTDAKADFIRRVLDTAQP